MITNATRPGRPVSVRNEELTAKVRERIHSFSDDQNHECIRSVDDIDVFTGGIYETPLPGAILGPTFACIIAEQFYRLKFGDRFFFEATGTKRGFQPEQLQTINQTSSLAALICRNTSVKKIQQRVLDSRRSVG